MTQLHAILLLVALVLIALGCLLDRWFSARQVEKMKRLLVLPPANPDILSVRGFDFYVRLHSGRTAEMVQIIRAAVGEKGTVYERGEWVVVLWQELDPPILLLLTLSRDLATDVIWLCFQKQVDAFEFIRWCDGEQVRRLTYGCYGNGNTWEKVEGTPEHWEAVAFFDQEELEHGIEVLRELPPKDKSLAEAEAELRSIWEKRILTPGSWEPSLIARDAAEVAATAYSLPGWEQ